jgi:hypothetical protein
LDVFAIAGVVKPTNISTAIKTPNVLFAITPIVFFFMFIPRVAPNPFLLRSIMIKSFTLMPEVRRNND